MEKVEALLSVRCLVGTGGIAAVQPLDGRHRVVILRAVFRHVLTLGVGPVGEQREIERTRPARQMSRFEVMNLFVDGLVATEHRRNNHECAHRCRDSAGEVQARQMARGNRHADQPVDDRDGDVGGREDCQRPEQQQNGGFDARVRARKHHDGEQDESQCEDSAEVKRQRDLERGPEELAREWNSVTDFAFDVGSPAIDQVVPGIVLPRVRLGVSLRGAPDGYVRNLKLGQRRSPREFFDGVPITVPGDKVMLA
jgi:hypothetical protein